MVSKPPSKGYAEAWLVESRTDVTKKYTVSKRSDGSFACDCPAWKFARAPKPECKHIQLVKAQLCGLLDRDLNPVREREVEAPPKNVQVRFNGELIAWITQEQAEQFKADIGFAVAASAPKPPAPTTTFGDFTIRRKFRLGGEQ